MRVRPGQLSVETVEITADPVRFVVVRLTKCLTSRQVAGRHGLPHAVVPTAREPADLEASEVLAHIAFMPPEDLCELGRTIAIQQATAENPPGTSIGDISERVVLAQRNFAGHFWQNDPLYRIRYTYA